MQTFDWENFELETKRLYLKKLTPSILKELFEKHSKEFIWDFLGLMDDSDWEREVMRVKGGYETHERTYLAFVMVRKDNNQTIGRAGFHFWYLQHNRAELGYALNHDDHKRKGYMSEALEAIIKYGFESMQLNRIEALVGPGNDASLNTLAKFGFVHEGHLRQHYVKNGIAEDSIAFSLLKEEYSSK